MQIFRDEHGDAGRSPDRGLLGVWEPTGELLVTADLVLYGLDEGNEVYAPEVPGALVGAPLRHATAGARLGVVRSYDHPVTSPGTLVPVVRCRPEESAASRLPAYDALAPSDELAPGVRVRIRTDPELTGEIEEVDFGITYPPEDPHSVPVFVVRVASSMTNPAELGAALVTDDGSGRLAGMLLRARLRADGETRCFCYAGHRILGEGG